MPVLSSCSMKKHTVLDLDGRLLASKNPNAADGCLQCVPFGQVNNRAYLIYPHSASLLQVTSSKEIIFEHAISGKR